MREIKFRAWDITNKKWILRKDVFVRGDGEIYVLDPNCPHEFILRNKEIEIMQFLDYQDKNGKYIFEGDIIAFDTSQICRGKEMGLIKFEQNILLYAVGFWLHILKDREFMVSVPLCEELMGCEVIGNICENPELLPPVNT